MPISPFPKMPKYFATYAFCNHAKTSESCRIAHFQKSSNVANIVTQNERILLHNDTKNKTNIGAEMGNTVAWNESFMVLLFNLLIAFMTYNHVHVQSCTSCSGMLPHTCTCWVTTCITNKVEDTVLGNSDLSTTIHGW